MSNSDSKQYCRSPRERVGGAPFIEAAKDEFPEPIELATTPMSRRGFLMAAGFSFGGATVLTGCKRSPVEKAIPFLVQPEEMTPGRALHYATTCGGCSAGCGALAKVRDGRPIKLEGNPSHVLSKGGLCAVGQASILGLYDRHRLTTPQKDGQDTTWDAVDDEINAKLETVRSEGGAVRVLTRSTSSPTTKRVIDSFLKRFDDAAHIVFEPVSCSAILDAHEQTHGTRLLPHYRFDQAEVIVSFDADFLGTWISPVEFTAAWSAGRRLDGDHPSLSYHAHIESRMSVTGSKADQRLTVHPGSIGSALSQLAEAIAQLAGAHSESGEHGEGPLSHSAVSDLAARLWSARGHSLVVCGSQDIQTQILCNSINHVLGNYEKTLGTTTPSLQRADNDTAFAALRTDIEAGRVKALIIHGVNPAFDLPYGVAFGEQIKSIDLVISCSTHVDETALSATFFCPDHHELESWGDAEPQRGILSLRQPTIAPLGKTRAFVESLSTWSGQKRTALDILRESWPDQQSFDQAVHDGVSTKERSALRTRSFNESAVSAIHTSDSPDPNALSLVLYQKVGMPDSSHAGNPWLHEMPDPISKMVWDNYAAIAPATAERLELKEEDVVSLKVGEAQLELPITIQPGQHENCVAVALGYGAQASERFTEVGPEWFERRPTVGENGRVGTNAAVLLTNENGTLHSNGAPVTLEKVNRTHRLSCTQDYHHITVPDHLAPPSHRRRPMIQETTFAALTVGATGHGDNHHDDESKKKDLWPDDHPYEGHHWGMVIDLTTCTGCSGCVVACQIENNVPVVGKDEVGRNRDMSWMRIDRYYADTEDGVDVAHQPMMCHHCDFAPCETVCPVLATVHSEEGLNQQVYNRCVGTRYCANNCPYKVRRFNWFQYTHNDALQNMVLNPDIVVRSRGVMEKCSFCVQRIHEAKAEAKRAGRPLEDGDVTPACQQSCPAGAIVFGDMNDPESAVAKLIAGGRHYRILEEINIRPSVGYLNVVRHRAAGQDEEGGHG